MSEDFSDRDLARRLVRTGYDDAAAAYTAFRRNNVEPECKELIAELERLLPDGGRLLDAGCGGGVIAALLTDRFDVVGVDVSMAQLRLARETAPDARYVCQDMVSLAFPDGWFDAVCSLWAIIHVPREDHASLLGNLRRMLRPQGLALMSFGRTHWEGSEQFFGGEIFWSHFDRDTSIAAAKEAGFDILRVVDAEDRPGTGTAPFLLARRR